MRQGIVVDTHPEDPSVDIVMADTGERLTGVKVMSGSGSARSGGVNLPDVQSRRNKWDVTESNGQDVWAAVGYVGGQPVVTGFITPPSNQIGIKDKATMYYRHQSDVQWSIDGEGNIQLQHPSGAYIRIGETPDEAPVATAQASSVDRNKGRLPNVRIGLSGGKGVLTFTPDGTLSIELAEDFVVEATGNATIKCQQATVEAPGGITLETPLVSVPNGDVVASGVSLVNHVNTGVMSGPSTSGPPAR